MTCYIRRDGRDVVALDGSTEIYRGRSVPEALYSCTSVPVIDLAPVRECSYCHTPLPAGYDSATVDEGCRMFAISCRLRRVARRKRLRRPYADELDEVAKRIAHMPPDRCGTK